MSENKIDIITNNNQKIIIESENINVFDDDETGWYYVYDYFDWRSGSLHEHETLEDSSDSFC